MKSLNFPAYTIKQQLKDDKHYLFDIVRKKYVVAQPEEWVRQYLIHFLINEKGVPKSLMAVERGVKVNQQFRRTDLVVYNKKNGRACFIAECKSPKVRITQATFDQIARYNMALKVKYLMVSNGLQHYCCEINHEQRQYHFLKDIPNYQYIIS